MSAVKGRVIAMMLLPFELRVFIDHTVSRLTGTPDSRDFEVSSYAGMAYLFAGPPHCFCSPL